MEQNKDKEYDKLWSSTLKKLREIADLEEKHNVVGISFAVEEGATITMEESLYFVASLIKNAAYFLAHKEKLYKPGFCPPK